MKGPAFFDVSNYNKINLKELDSIRGLMAIFILGCHFFAAFGNVFPKNGIFTPFGILTNATIGLCYFFLLSGFVITYSQQKKMRNTSIVKYTINRFWRLLPPVLISILLMYIFQKNGWLTISTKTLDHSAWLQGLYQFTADKQLINPLIDATYNTYIRGNVLYNANLWAIKYEFIIPILLVLVGPFLQYRLIRIALILFVVLSISGIHGNRYFWIGTMLFGAVLCYYIRLIPYYKVRNVFLIIGLLFIIITNVFSIYSIVGSSLLRIFNLISSIFITIIVLNENGKLKNYLLNNKIICYLGKISYEIYVFHLFVLLTLSPLILYSLEYKLGYSISVIVSYILTIFVVVVISSIFHEIVSVNCNKLKIK